MERGRQKTGLARALSLLIAAGMFGASCRPRPDREVVLVISGLTQEHTGLHVTTSLDGGPGPGYMDYALPSPLPENPLRLGMPIAKDLRGQLTLNVVARAPLPCEESTGQGLVKLEDQLYPEVPVMLMPSQPGACPGDGGTPDGGSGMTAPDQGQCPHDQVKSIQWKNGVAPDQGMNFYAIAATPDGNEAWAVGGVRVSDGSSQVWHWNGVEWAQDPGVPSIGALYDVWLGGPSDIWALGLAYMLKRSPVGGWAQVPHPPDSLLGNSYGFIGDGDHFWVVGEGAIVEQCPRQGKCTGGPASGVSGSLLHIINDGSSLWTIGTGGFRRTISGNWELAVDSGSVVIRAASTVGGDVWFGGDAQSVWSWRGGGPAIRYQVPGVSESYFSVGKVGAEIWIAGGSPSTDYGDAESVARRCDPGLTGCLEIKKLSGLKDKRLRGMAVTAEPSSACNIVWFVGDHGTILGYYP